MTDFSYPALKGLKGAYTEPPEPRKSNFGGKMSKTKKPAPEPCKTPKKR